MSRGSNRVTRTLSCPLGACLLRLRLADQAFTRKLVIAGNQSDYFGGPGESLDLPGLPAL